MCYGQEMHSKWQVKKQAEGKWRRTLLEVDRNIDIEVRAVSNTCENNGKAGYFNKLHATADQKTTLKCLCSRLKVANTDKLYRELSNI